MPVRRRPRLLCTTLAVAAVLAGSPLAPAQPPSSAALASLPAPLTEIAVPPNMSSAAGVIPGLVPAGPSPGMPLTLLVPPIDKDGTADYVPAPTNVGFIDPASPWNVVRLRYDAAYDLNRPTRGDYIITGSGPLDRGFKVPTASINYQEASLYAEYTLLPQFSWFIEAPWRSVDPQFNPTYSGMGDINTGFKLLGIQTQQFTGSFQLKVYAPTGKTQDGLGTGHVSAQPGILSNWRPLPDWPVIAEGEVSCWIPIDASSYGGQMMIYGVGFSCCDRPCDKFWGTPVAEFTGWTLLRGKEQVVYSPQSFFAAHAGSDCIANGNLGVRAGFGDKGDIFVGYSRALTGDVWWKEMWRVELRLRY